MTLRFTIDYESLRRPIRSQHLDAYFQRWRVNCNLPSISKVRSSRYDAQAETRNPGRALQRDKSLIV
jgi:hypothetical protein